MKRTKLFIFDVNALVSAFILESDTNAVAFDKAMSIGRIITSKAIQLELSEVFLRSKFDRYVKFNDRLDFLKYLDRQILLWPVPLPVIHACRDPKDDMFLELAVGAKASCIITGDKGLRALHPFRGIPILNAADFIALY